MTIRFEIATPLGFSVRTTDAYWQKLIIKHPDIASLEDLVQQALQNPDEIRQSSRDHNILLFVTVPGITLAERSRSQKPTRMSPSTPLRGRLLLFYGLRKPQR